ncbi:MAG: capsule assembly Wzi family protein [Ignavibacteriae bacterium]|nr:capsule assembly Wzi family protein [Ignavibacteriota bacterium]
MPSQHEVYAFLKRMEARQLLKGYRDAAKPLPRTTVAKFLGTLESSRNMMTTVEQETYDYLKEEFVPEFALLDAKVERGGGRDHMLSLSLHHGEMYVDPNLELRGKTNSDGDVYTWVWGAKAYGYISDAVGFYFNQILAREGGEARDIAKKQTPERGIVVQRGKLTFFEYNTTEAQITFGWKDVRFSLEKMQNVWGLGRQGSLILSDKAPSYPQIKLRIALADWMDFIYLHGDLHSNVVDSARSYRATTSQITDSYRTVYRSKYIAAHQFEITPIDGLDISIGESVIYSDKGPQFIYLVPLMLFKSAEHYNRDTDNVQIFGSADVNLIPNVNLYLSVFVDELNTEELFSESGNRNQAGFTGGVQLYDIGIENSELLIEYTRLNPWTYTHKFPATTFTNNGYELGHWISQNSDHLYAEAVYRFSRPLRVSVFAERLRHGGLTDIVEQYIPPAEPFLYGPVRRVSSYGLSGEYQLVRDGFIFGSARWNTISDEGATFKNRSGQLEVALTIRYGLW